MKRPNVIFVFSDQHRSQACGFHGDSNVCTPNMDRFAEESTEFSMAVSGMPVCCPYRASLLTGQYPHHHGIFLNDLCLSPKGLTMGDLFKNAGYDTAYIGKWHLDGHGRSTAVPPERRLGFDYWKVMECTHDYNQSYYYSSETGKGEENNQIEGNRHLWSGYDADAQTEDAISYIKSRVNKEDKNGSDLPFLLVLSWGPPHDPYDTAPEAFKKMYDPDAIQLRPNVPEYQAAVAQKDLAGYYAHISALDACLGKLIGEVKKSGIWEDTIFIYTSDHGDMLCSQGVNRKQKPWDESIRVPFLLSYPRRFGNKRKEILWPLNSPDILPTLLDLCRICIPEYVDGRSLVPYMDDENEIISDDFHPAVLLQCINPNGEWHKFKGGRPYRGIRTRRYTYVRDLNGPWLLYDNVCDPYQLENLLERDCEDSELLECLDRELDTLMREAGDELLPAHTYLKKWGYNVDFLGTNLYLL